MSLRDYQRQWVADVYAAWNSGARNVVGLLPTGGGKTTCFSHILKELSGAGCVVAHRQELVSQAALSLNREGVYHGIIAPEAVISQVVALQMETHGKSYYKPRADIRVAGVDTLVARGSEKDRWFSGVQTVVMDEGHHVLATNKWGKAMALFPSARGLFPTAHALRADGAGLGRNADGLADALVVGPSCRTLIDRGFLCDYRLICPPESVDISDVEISPETGELKQNQLRAAIHKSGTIVGDVAKHYMQFAAGKLGLTFAVDLESAEDIAKAYRACGVPAEIITAKTPIRVRGQLMRKFRAREILQLVSVDVLGEGTDVPAVEVISMARHTASFQLYAQQFGRGLRVMVDAKYGPEWDSIGEDSRKWIIAASVKPSAIIIDHVGNWQRHMPLPDMPRPYTLDRRERGAKKGPDDEIPLRTCLNEACFEPFERVLSACPHCGTPVPAPARRGSPEYVDGDLFELDPETLAQLRGEVARIDGAARVPENLKNSPAEGAIKRRHFERQNAQHWLRKAISLYGGWQDALGRPRSESYKRFFFNFGIDVLTAQSLNAADATALYEKISAHLAAAGVVEGAPT